jgi:predicted acetyltransferase
MVEIGKFGIEIAEAKEKERSSIQNLARFYVYDLSEYQNQKCLENGLFEDDNYIRFWKNPGHYPYLIRCQDEIAGFVLVRKGDRNKPAVNFWEKTIAEYIQGQHTTSSEFHNTDMEVIRFSNDTL